MQKLPEKRSFVDMSALCDWLSNKQSKQTFDFDPPLAWSFNVVAVVFVWSKTGLNNQNELKTAKLPAKK